MDAALLTATTQGLFDAFLLWFFPCFSRHEPRELFLHIILALCASLDRRKNCWWIAQHIGDLSPQRVQNFFLTHKWDANNLRDRLIAYIIKHIGEDDGVFIGDETGFEKKGKMSAGVARQYTGTAGGIVNCQIGVFLSYATSRGAALIDRMLYLPQEWTENRKRCRDAGIPDAVGFQTKPQMLLSMLEHAIRNGVCARWVVADEVYGNNPALRKGIENLGLGYVLTVPKNFRCLKKFEAQQVAAWWPLWGWKRLSAGEGSKGPRLYDWALRTLPGAIAGWEYALLMRRSISDPTDLAFFTVFAPEGTSLEKLARVAGTRWNIETSFQQTKNEVGLDNYELRTHTGWYRHITMTMCAHAFLTVAQIAVRRAEGIDEKKRDTQPRGRRRAHLASRGAAPDFRYRLDRTESLGQEHHVPLWVVRMASKASTTCTAMSLA
jgi:SRSO17 transposase